MFGWLKNLFSGFRWSKPGKGKYTVVYEEHELNHGTQHRAAHNEALTDYLHKVYRGKAYAEYGGSTLFVAQEMMDGQGYALPQGTQTFWLNVGDEDLEPEIHYWVCMCYIKYKCGTSNTEKYEKVLSFVEEYASSDKLALNILEA